MKMPPERFNGSFVVKATMCAAAAMACTFAAIGDPPDKEAMHDQMMQISQSMDGLRPLIATDPAAAAEYDALHVQYNDISSSLGGDDPGSKRTLSSDGGGEGGSTSGGPALPVHCNGETISYSNSTPVPILDNSSVTTTIVVSGANPNIADVNLRTYITHTFAADLQISIRSPQGTVVTLTTNNGGGADNVFNGTVWDDDANPGGQVPYASNPGLTTDHPYANNVVAAALVPEEAMGAFAGEDPNGEWLLKIADVANIDVGVCHAWSLEITAVETTPYTTTASASSTAAVAISSGPPSVVSSDIVASGLDSFLCDVNLTTFITHTFNGDLDITLRSPAGTVVTITTDNGGPADNVFNGTVWDDSANPGGQVPYATNPGVVTDRLYPNNVVVTPLVPEEAMGAFYGENPNGTWTLTVRDDSGGNGGSLDSWSLSMETCTCNDPPVCATGLSTTLWPPNHTYHIIDLNAVGGATDANGDSLTYEIDTMTQDEPVNSNGDGNSSCDGIGVGFDSAMVRAERQGGGNGRVYAINYTVSDGYGGSCTGTYDVYVPHNQNGGTPTDDGQSYDSAECFNAADINADVMVNVTDLMRVISDWGQVPGRSLSYPEADTNLDAIVNVYDLLLVITNWGNG